MVDLKALWTGNKNFPHTVDIMQELVLINKALNRQGPFMGAPAKGIIQFINKTAQKMMDPIHEHIRNDDLYTHWNKIRLLEQAYTSLGHLMRCTRHDSNWNQANEQAVQDALRAVNAALTEYAQTGSVYLIRHCAKEKHLNKAGEVYDGIPKHAIKSQAMALARSIKREAHISPKKVLVVISHSDKPRTRIFGEIIARVVEQANHESPGKVTIVRQGEDKRLALYFDEKDTEAAWILEDKTKGPYYFEEHWIREDAEFAHYTKQPDPDLVYRNMLSFLHDGWAYAGHPDDTYKIVIGVSHSGPIDTLMYHLIPEMRSDVRKLLDTAAFCKVECGEFGYLGKWVRFP